MSLVRADNLGMYFGADLVFRQVSFVLDDRSRVGLVGPNGEGKTTLLKIILDQIEWSEGDINRRRDLRLGYLPQVPPALDDRTVWEFCHSVFAELLSKEDTLHELAVEMGDPDCPKEVFTRYERLQHEFEAEGGYTVEPRIHRVLSGLGFTEEYLQMPMTQLSGGWRTRAYLARLLLEEPDILMLDEPTNHLDMAATRWLESFLKDWRKCLLIVSHDRFLLEQLTRQIWELAGGSMQTYKGNYSAFLAQRSQRFEERMKIYEEQQAHIRETEEFIRKHLAGQRTKEAQGRRTRLQRFIEREVIQKPKRMRGIRLNFGPISRTGDIVLRTEGLAIGYEPGVPIAEIPELEIQRGQRLAVIGSNGSGKTTFLRTLTEELSGLAGEYTWGTGVKRGYLSQEHDTLDPEQSLLDSVREAQKQKSDQAARDLLGSLLFTGEDVFKQVANLSGGERSRLALARLALEGANLLLLDEPTNHLDIPSQEVLQGLLDSYPGTLVFVSHDRYLIDGLATHLLVFSEDGVELFQGNWQDFRRQQQEAEATASTSGEGTPAAKDGFRKRKRRENARRRLEERHARLEDEIHELEQEKKLLEYAISKAGEEQNLTEVTRLGEEFKEKEAALEQHWEEWARVAEQLEG